KSRIEVVPVGGNDTVGGRRVGDGAVDPGRRRARAEDQEAIGRNGDAAERLAVVAEAERQRDGRLRVVGQRHLRSAGGGVHPGERLLQQAVAGLVGRGDGGLWG